MPHGTQPALYMLRCISIARPLEHSRRGRARARGPRGGLGLPGLDARTHSVDDGRGGGCRRRGAAPWEYGIRLAGERCPRPACVRPGRGCRAGPRLTFARSADMQRAAGSARRPVPALLVTSAPRRRMPRPRSPGRSPTHGAAGPAPDHSSRLPAWGGASHAPSVVWAPRAPPRCGGYCTACPRLSPLVRARQAHRYFAPFGLVSRASAHLCTACLGMSPSHEGGCSVVGPEMSGSRHRLDGLSASAQSPHRPEDGVQKAEQSRTWRR